MSHEAQQSKSGQVVPFVLVILATAFLILVSDLSHPNVKPEETKTETPAH